MCIFIIIKLNYFSGDQSRIMNIYVLCVSLIDSEAELGLGMQNRYWIKDQYQHTHTTTAHLNTSIPIQSLLTNHHAVQEHCL